MSTLSWKQFRAANEVLGWNYTAQNDKKNDAARVLGRNWRTIARYAQRDGPGCTDQPTARLLRMLLLMHGTINVIHPYKHKGLWVFDDPHVGLEQEPFVAGTDTIIDRATADLHDAARGFRLMFSSTAFPGHQLRLDWLREENGGNWYRSSLFEIDGWLCPALLKYFEKAPKVIFIKVS
jgi:hypothetical protein